MLACFYFYIIKNIHGIGIRTNTKLESLRFPEVMNDFTIPDANLGTN